MTMGTAVDKAFNAMIVGIGRAANRMRRTPKPKQWEPDEVWAAQFRRHG